MLCAEDVVKAHDRCHPSNFLGEQPHSMIVDLIEINRGDTSDQGDKEGHQ